MSVEIWQEIPAVDEVDLRPILSTVTNGRLEEQVKSDLGLSDADAVFSALNARCLPLHEGRQVLIRSLGPVAIRQRVELLETPTDPRWFRAADFTMKLMATQSQGCYGGWHDSFALRVFGQ